MDWLTSNSMRMIEKSLDYTWRKQRIIAENIANNETPGYKAKYITFEEAFQRNLAAATGSLTSGNAAAGRKSRIQKAIGETGFTYHTSTAETTRLDGNNVNTDVETAELARTQLQYEYLVKQMSDQFTRLRIVIEGR